MPKPDKTPEEMAREETQKTLDKMQKARDHILSVDPDALSLEERVALLEVATGLREPPD